MLSRVRGSLLQIVFASLALGAVGTLAVLALMSLGLMAGSSRAHAQTKSTSDELRLIESTERDLDPLGLDEDTGKGLEEAARALKAPQAKEPVAEVGDVLSAIEGVFESGHNTQIKLAGGLAFVAETIEISNRTPHAAEVAYRLRIPEDSALWSFRVCIDTHCREAWDAVRSAQQTKQNPANSEGDGDLPTGQVLLIREGKARALSILARPIGKKPITLRIAYVTAAPVHGGQVRLTLPARGFDPRIVPAHVSVESRELGELLPHAEFTADPSLAIEVVGTLKARPNLVHVRTISRCGGLSCSREYRAAAAQPIHARETWLLLDASPSMEGVARSRLPAVIAALLSKLPDDTRVRAFAFAASAQDLGSWPAIEVPLSKLDDALLSDRGAGTRVSSVLTPFHDELARKRPRVIVLSDAALDPDPREQRAIDRARRSGAELSMIALADQAPSARSSQLFLGSGGVVHITDLADRALSRGELEPLVERVTALLSVPVTGGLRAGESSAIERRSPTLASGQDASDWLPSWLARKDAAPVWIAAAKQPVAAIRAPAYADIPLADPREATGMPKESVLDLLRTQLVPKARACLRGDRKGRADYAVGLAFRFLIARREVLDASIDGQVPAGLRACLLEVLPQLRMPWFTGNLRVRYPIHTEREPEPPVIVLEPDAAHAVDRVFAAPAPRRSH